MDLLRYLVSEMWISPDKGIHFVLSACIGAIAYWWVRRRSGEGPVAVLAALAAVTVAGLLREVSDFWAGKYFSEKDMIWNYLGAAAGVWVSGRFAAREERTLRSG